MSGPEAAVSLFAGIGGIDVALERAGLPTLALVEIDPACRRILARHFPNARIFSDVREVTADDIRATGFAPERGILTAGWPCQGNSVGGRRLGMVDPRSQLWMHVARLLDKLRPAWFLFENVPGLYTVRGGRDIAIVRRDIAYCGYRWTERVLDAQYFGIPQRRRRIYFVGHIGDGAYPVQILFDSESGSRHPQASGQPWAGDTGAAKNGANGASVSTLTGGGRRGHRLDAEMAAGGQLIAHALSSHHGRDDINQQDYALVGFANQHRVRTGPVAEPVTGSNRQPGGITDGAMVRRLTPRECERLQGFPDDWTDGQADSVRYRQLGNAVAVPVAEWIIQRLVKAAA